jgi:hypothetical protein
MIEIILFLVGIIGLIGGNLTFSRNSPLTGHRARIAGLILALSLPLYFGFFALVSWLARTDLLPPLMEYPFLQWYDLIAAMPCILGAGFYVYFTSPARNPDTLRFWLIAGIPAIVLYIANNLTFLYQSLFYFSMGLPLPLMVSLLFSEIIIQIFIPVVIAFGVNLIFPISTNWSKAVLFSIPVIIIYINRAILYLIFPGIMAIIYPGDTPGAGYQMITNGLIYILVSLLLMMFVAFVSWAATRIRRKL